MDRIALILSFLLPLIQASQEPTPASASSSRAVSNSSSVAASSSNTYSSSSFVGSSSGSNINFLSSSVTPDRSTAQATTSLSSIPGYTPTKPYSALKTPPYQTVTPNTTLPACKKIQYDFAKGEGCNPGRADAVREAYEYAWDAYKTYAFGKDELKPLTKDFRQDWYGWGVTIVDGIDTAIVMNLTDIVAEQLAFIETIDFSVALDGPVEIFDTSIRYIGGLLSSYDLLNSGKFYNSYPKSQIDALLSQAATLADKIAFTFDTPTGLPGTYLNWQHDRIDYQGQSKHATNTASCGTFILEWYRLSDLTGNQTYRAIAERAESWLVDPSPAPVYPGLVGAEFDVDTGKMLTFDGGWHSEVDSFLEYLIKTYQYEQTATTTRYKDFWLQAAQSTDEHLLLHPYGFPDLTFLSVLDERGRIGYSQDDYSCFSGGNFLLGGALLGKQELIDMGIRVTDGCHQTYNQTLTGLGPLAWAWYNSSNLAYHVADDNDASERKFAAKHGFFIINGDEDYSSYPESIESIFYAHRITGDPRWADYNWKIFQAINDTARNDVAFASVNNVNMPYGGSQSNHLDSFFFAEVLKYLYLSFADPDVINLEHFVFNTESHPMLVQCGKLGNIDDRSYTGPVNGTKPVNRVRH